MEHKKLTLEIDNFQYDKSYLNSMTYASLINDELRKFHLKEGTNCTFYIFNNDIYLRLYNCNKISIDKLKKIILKKKKDKIVGRFLFPINEIVIIDNHTLKIKTRFYAPLIQQILQSPWIFNFGSNLQQEFKFVFNRDYETRFSLLKNGDIDVTWPANGKWTDESLKKYFKDYTFYNLPGNNLFTIYSTNHDFIEIVYYLKFEIITELKKLYNGQFDYISSFIKEEYHNKVKCSRTLFKEKYKRKGLNHVIQPLFLLL